MQLLDNTLNNLKVIGSFDTPSDKVGTSVLQLAGKFGMTNPATPINSSTKGIIIKKNGKKYTITLGMFNPPIILNWTAPFSISALNKVIDDIAKQNQKIGYLNVMNIDNSQFVQIAIG